jgi:hypothetical protein
VTPWIQVDNPRRHRPPMPRIKRPWSRSADAASRSWEGQHRALRLPLPLRTTPQRHPAPAPPSRLPRQSPSRLRNQLRQPPPPRSISQRHRRRPPPALAVVQVVPPTRPKLAPRDELQMLTGPQARRPPGSKPHPRLCRPSLEFHIPRFGRPCAYDRCPWSQINLLARSQLRAGRGECPAEAVGHPPRRSYRRGSRRSSGRQAPLRVSTALLEACGQDSQDAARSSSAKGSPLERGKEVML